MPRLGGGGLGLVMTLLLGASCGEGPAAPSSGTPAPMAPPTARALVAGGTGPGLRVDMAGTTHHVRALERQPDGTYRSICTDSADALRPAVARPPGAPR